MVERPFRPLADDLRMQIVLKIENGKTSIDHKIMEFFGLRDGDLVVVKFLGISKGI